MPESPAAHVAAQDVVYVGGGNTANMLAIWRMHGVDGALRTAWQRGAVVGGMSAGANCWFEDSVTDSFGPQLRALGGGLGLARGAQATVCYLAFRRRERHSASQAAPRRPSQIGVSRT
jgi:cyanophycinase-like exopeptidase